ncbi:hypothetical protein JCM19237_2058 [Photobacterium aphoticum]|uniref:Uncharacterized protein n=1 Tax=Photobacterium aphoticum TaxID=754436 RepID=A0A090R8H3_9GAMM|nr:hypothetical protein JCM19237_2058 [Photobacterium aphoticum]
MHRMMNERIEALREYASHEENILHRNDRRFIMVDGREYEVGKNNYLYFDIPRPFHNEEMFRHIFGFFNEDWELSLYERGMVAVNRIYGNYDYGNGCLMEYNPSRPFTAADGTQTPFSLEISTCQVDEGRSHQQLRYLGKGTQLTHETFGYAQSADFVPESVALHGDKVYVGNTNSGFSRIDRYDMRTQKALPPITGFTLNGQEETYRVVSDVTEHNGRLFVASLSSNRVDVYDLNNNDEIIMSLGTGVYWGDKFVDALTHPYSVAANDEYVFVADITGKISIYQQSDVTQANHKRAVKHAFFDLPDSNSIWRNIKMEVVANELIVSFDNSNTYVFGIDQIEPGQTLIPAKQIINNSQRRNVFEAQNGTVFTGTSQGKVELFNKGDLQFNEHGVATTPAYEFNTYFNATLDKEVTTKASWDLAANTDTLAMLQDNTILLADMESLKVYVNNAPAWDPVPELDLNAFEVERKQLLTNEESWESLTQNHEVRVNRLLSGKQRLDSLEIISYAAQRTFDLDVEARFGKTGPWVKLGSISELEPFTSFKLDQTLEDNVYYPTTNDGQSVTVMGLKDLSYMPSNLIDIRLTSDTDTFVQKITDLKPNWRLRFGTYSPETHGNWGRITGPYAREWMIMMANFAYIMNSPEFEHIWFNYKETWGQGTQEFYGNAGPVDAPNGNFTAEDYTRVYQNFMNRDLIELGVSTIGGGLGGGSVLGIDTWLFYSHYYREGFGILAHEFGHGFGSHDSAYANGGAGFQPLISNMHHMMLLDKTLPYIDDNINAFYTSPRELLHNGIAEHLRVPFPEGHTNWAIEYFKNNPISAK